jgi:nitrate reductase gamma subunit
MNAFVSLFAVVVLVLIGYFGAQSASLQSVFGIIFPYAAIATFLIGVIYRIISWARSAVPFRVPNTCGQQKSLSWIKNDNLDNPHNIWGVIGRMFLEVVAFRSLFRNTRADLTKDDKGAKLVYGGTKWLWLAGLAFHYAFLIIFIRHFKYFAEPVPFWVTGLQELDGFFQIGLPILYLTDVIIVAAVTYLLLRRLVIPQIKYISLAADYFPLFLILGIALSGMYMRYFVKVDILGIKALATGLLSFSPAVPAGVGAPFYVHFFLVCVLLAYFPFSKLMHMGGVFLSPTRNLANNNRAVRHINPWNYPVKEHTYEEFEEEFHEKMKSCGLPLVKEYPEPQPPAAKE